MPMIRYGEPCWIEIPVTNAPRAIQFYRTVFEWNIDDQGYDKQVDGVERTYFFSKGNLHGSFMLVPEDQFVDISAICAPNTADEDEQAKKPRWSVVNTFAVEDMDETLEKVVQCGGRIFQLQREIVTW